MIGGAPAHDLGQQLVDGALERLEVWLPRRGEPLEELVAAAKVPHLGSLLWGGALIPVHSLATN